MRLHRTLVALLSVGALAACGDKSNSVQDPAGPAPNSGILFYNFGVNTPSVQFYNGEQKLTATSSTSCQAALNPPKTATDSTCLTTGILSTTGLTYGSIAASNATGAQYVGLDAGSYTITAKIATTADFGTVIATLPVTVEDGKHYSFFLSGLYNAATKTADAFYVEDPVPAIPTDYTKAYVRLVNAVGNGTAPLTLYALPTGGTGETAWGTAVAYKTAGAFVPVTPGAYDLRVRYADATNRIVRAGTPFVGGHYYTVVARGDMTVTSTTATNRPILDLTTNR